MSTEASVGEFQSSEGVFSSMSDADIVGQVSDQESSAPEESGGEEQSLDELFTKAGLEDESKLDADEGSNSPDDESVEKSAEKIEEESIKKLKALHGESELEIPEDAMFTLKVNGQEESVSLATLRDQYAGKVGYDKKFNELNLEKRDFLNNIKQPLEMQVKRFATVEGTNAKISVLAEMAGLQGEQAVEFTQNFLRSAREEAAQYLEMNEAERALHDKESALKLKEQQYESQRKSVAEREQTQNLQAQIKSECEALGIDEAKFGEGLESLVKYNPELLNKSIEPQMVTQWIKAEQRFDLVDETLQKIDPSLVGSSTALQLVERSLNNNLDDKATIKIIETYFKKSSDNVKIVNEKLKQAKPKVTEAKKETNNKQNSELDDINSFDDLDELLKRI